MHQSDMTQAKEALTSRCRSIVGARYVLTSDQATRRFRTGYSHGEGKVLAVVRPGSLLEQWKVLQACVDAGVIIIMQAANTGITGGSTPFGEGYDREIVIINGMRIGRIDLLRGGDQVLALPGVRLDDLEKALRPLKREPHSVIGSSCIGASVTGGVCNNSGGTLIQRGPAYTQYALFAQVDQNGKLCLVNHLDIDLGEDPETILTRLDNGQYSENDVSYSSNKWASDREYGTHIRDIDAASPARFNADPRRHYEAAGSAGKLAVFALRLDSFPVDENAAVFYIGTNDRLELTKIRRHILANFRNLPISGEVLQREGYDLTRKYGKDVFLLIKHLGTDRVPGAFALKSRFDGLADKLGFGNNLSDRVLQFAMGFLPNHLPKRMNAYRDRFEYHLILKMGGSGAVEARDYLAKIFPSSSGDFFECSEAEGHDAYLHRFAFGGASIRYRAVNRSKVEGVVTLDIALPRNAVDWLPELPEDIQRDIVGTCICGHFFCHVIHQDYSVRKGADPAAVKMRILAFLDSLGAEYPAEHNVGHLYKAKPALETFYRELDPTNSFNTGIGMTSKNRGWN